MRVALGVLMVIGLWPALADCAWLRGAGVASCAEWTLETDNYARPSILGYWSGLNEGLEMVYKRGQAGRYTDVNAMVVEAKGLCSANPRRTIVDVAAEVLVNVEARERDR